MATYDERSKTNRLLANQFYLDATNDPNLQIQIGGLDGQTGRYKVIHADGGVTSNGDKIFNASAPQDGFVRGNASGNAIALDHRQHVRSDRILIQEDPLLSGNKALFIDGDDYYVGGDRSPAELVYSIPEEFGGYGVSAPVFRSTGEGLDEWTLDFFLQRSVSDLWRIYEAKQIILGSESSYDCYVAEDNWFVLKDPASISFRFNTVRPTELKDKNGAIIGEYYLVNIRYNTNNGGQAYARFQLSLSIGGAIAAFSQDTFVPEIYADQYVLISITSEGHVTTIDSGVRFTTHTISSVGSFINVLQIEYTPTGYGWWAAFGSQLGHWYSGGQIYSRWNGVKQNFKLIEGEPLSLEIYNTPTLIPTTLETTSTPSNGDGANGDFRILALSNPEVLYKKIGGTWQVQPFVYAFYSENRICQTIDYVIDENIGATVQITGNKSDYFYRQDNGSSIDLNNIRNARSPRFYNVIPSSGVGTTEYIGAMGFESIPLFSQFDWYLPKTGEIGNGIVGVFSRGIENHIVIQEYLNIRHYIGEAYTYLNNIFFDRVILGFLSNGIIFVIEENDEQYTVKAYSLTDIAVDGSEVKLLEILDPALIEFDTLYSVGIQLTLEEFDLSTPS